MNNSKSYHLSVVAASRNDDHGGSLLERMQKFVDGFVVQCNRHKLRAELVLVDWNPPSDRAPLAEVFRYTKLNKFCDIRVITVPAEIHKAYKHADKLPLYQMIAKNVGIRRARGRFILATNIDILFSDEIVCFMRDHLKKNTLYRADRFDIPPSVPSMEDFNKVLTFCKENAFRINGKYRTYLRRGGRWVLWPSKSIRMKNFLLRAVKTCLKNLRPPLKWSLQNFRIKKRLHTNACGDFTLTSREVWSQLRAYPEWDMYSWHIDSVFLHQASIAGYEEVDLSRQHAIYHMEHAVGSGYTHDAPSRLFARLEKIQLPYLSNEALLRIVEQLKKNKCTKKFFLSDENWGFAYVDLDICEISIGAAKRVAEGAP